MARIEVAQVVFLLLCATTSFLFPRYTGSCRSRSAPTTDQRSASHSCLHETEKTKHGVVILDSNEHFLVVEKPSAVPCHYSDYLGSGGCLGVVPMLQQVRDTVGKQVNLVHRLDRGASGCLLMTFAADEDTQATRLLSEALTNRTSSKKTYVALVRGEGILRGRDFRQEGWFLVDRPIRNERGVLKNASTWFRFVAGQDNNRGRDMSRARASLVLAKPVTGRWHQIRKHLNGLSHPILGDSTHGNSKVNREWRETRGLPSERTCLHLGRLQVAPTAVSPQGIDARSRLAADMTELLQRHLPDVLKDSLACLETEGILL